MFIRTGVFWRSLHGAADNSKPLVNLDLLQGWILIEDNAIRVMVAGSVLYEVMLFTWTCTWTLGTIELYRLSIMKWSMCYYEIVCEYWIVMCYYFVFFTFSIWFLLDDPLNAKHWGAQGHACGFARSPVMSQRRSRSGCDVRRGPLEWFIIMVYRVVWYDTMIPIDTSILYNAGTITIIK